MRRLCCFCLRKEQKDPSDSPQSTRKAIHFESPPRSRSQKTHASTSNAQQLSQRTSSRPDIPKLAFEGEWSLDPSPRDGNTSTKPNQSPVASRTASSASINSTVSDISTQDVTPTDYSDVHDEDLISEGGSSHNIKTYYELQLPIDMQSTSSMRTKASNEDLHGSTKQPQPSANEVHEFYISSGRSRSFTS